MRSNRQARIKTGLKRGLRVAGVLILMGVGLAGAARLWSALRASEKKFEQPMDVPDRKVAVVFGAGIRGNQPSAILYDRVAIAAGLYQAGKVQKLLMSGDNRFANYNEPAVMRSVALQLGVPNEAIVLDYAGRSTYETCYRANAIFGLSEAVLVTQDFHLDRAIATCDLLGVSSVGIKADLRPYRAMTWYQLREIPATLNMLLQTLVTRPLPVLGEREPI